jgi:Flp pilus assembly protein TadD/prefoldin subunit 5
VDQTRRDQERRWEKEEQERREALAEKERKQFKKARKLLRAGHGLEAELAFRSYLGEFSETANVDLGLGLALSIQRKWVDAQRVFERVIHLNNDDPTAHKMLASILVWEGRYRDAEPEWRELIRLNPTDEDPHDNLGTELLYDQLYADAEVEFRHAVQLNPKSVYAHSNLAWTLAEQKRFGEAAAEYRQTFSFQPRVSDWPTSLGIVLSLQKQYFESESAFRDAVRLDPKNPRLHEFLGDSLDLQGKYEAAEAELRKAIRLNQADSNLHVALAITLSHEVADAEAENEFREAIQRNPGGYKGYQGWGEMLFMDGRYKDAEFASRYAVSLNNKEVQPHIDLARALERQGDVEGAMTEYSEAHRLQPDETYAEENLKRLTESKATKTEISACQHLLVGLHHQVSDTQDALRRVSRSSQVDASQRDEWVRETQAVTQDAVQRGRDMMFGGVLDFLDARFDKQLADTNRQIQTTIDSITNETRKNRREQLNSTIKALQQQRTEIRRSQELVSRRGRDARDFIETVNWANSKPDDLQKALEGSYLIIQQLLENDSVKKVLKLGEAFGKTATSRSLPDIATYSKSVLDSGYDVSVEAVSIKRIQQLDTNTENYLTSVRELSQRMERLFAQIKTVEEWLSAEQQRGGQ